MWTIIKLSDSSNCSIFVSFFAFLEVCSFIKFEPFEIYDQNLKLLPDPLREMEAGLNGAKVIGYYCFRRNLPLTVRRFSHFESHWLVAGIHKNFHDCFSRRDPLDKAEFSYIYTSSNIINYM